MFLSSGIFFTPFCLYIFYAFLAVFGLYAIAAAVLMGYFAALRAVIPEDPAHKGALELKARYGASIWDFSGYQRWIDQDIQSVFDVCWELASQAYILPHFGQ